MFRRRYFSVEIILVCGGLYCKYGISYRDLTEMMQERGVEVDPSTIMRWVQRYAPELEKRVRLFQEFVAGPLTRLDRLRLVRREPQAKRSCPFPASDADNPYCYPGTDMLRNQLGICDKQQLQTAETVIGALRNAQLNLFGLVEDE